jgi:hypothetical protein
MGLQNLGIAMLILAMAGIYMRMFTWMGLGVKKSLTLVFSIAIVISWIWMGVYLIIKY